MKKLITLTLALVLLSCAKEEAPEYTVVSGKLTGTEQGKFTVRGISFEQEIPVDQDGTFADTLYLNYNGAYRIGRAVIYLHQGKNLSFDADAKKLEEITFTGDLAAENNYITQKSKISNEVLGSNTRELYSLEEEEFVAKVEQLVTAHNELLENTTFSIKDFEKNELKSIAYNEASLLNNYTPFHKRITLKEDFEVSDNFPKADQTIDFDHANDFYFSTAYRELLNTRFNNMVRDEYTKEIGEEFEAEKYYEITLKHYKNIKSENIKNTFANEVAYGISPSNEKSEILYNELMASVTDENFKTELTEKYNKIKTLTKGQPSPTFDYENHKGGTTSLDDLKGKYVYIDVWATWCGPCKREIPFLKEVEKEYHGKNIEIVSISIDDKKDYEKWKDFVADQELSGVQLYADKAWQSQFVTDYAIEGIPRFILVDPQGNIVSADAPRPSDPQLIELFEELGI